MSQHPRYRSGFTLIELLVVIAIIGVLVGLLLTAVQQAREAARRASCTNNLKQLALAIASYESAMKVYPPGCQTFYSVDSSVAAVDGEDAWGWFVFILPFVEEQVMHDTLDPNAPTAFKAALNSPLKLKVMQSTVSLMGCPSDASENPNDMRLMNGHALGVTNYVGSFGVDGWALPDSGGVLFTNSKIKINTITDGLSKTFLVGERMSGEGLGLHRAGLWSGGLRVLIPSILANPLESVGASFGSTKWRLNSGEDLVGGPFWPAGAFASAHPNIAQFAFCDGSVRQVDESIDSRVTDVNVQSSYGIYQSLSHRSDGNVTNF